MKSRLFDIFAQFGEVAYIKVPRVHKSSKGYAFVEFSTKDASDAVLARHASEPVMYDDHRLVINLAQRPRAKAPFEERS